MYAIRSYYEIEHLNEDFYGTDISKDDADPEHLVITSYSIHYTKLYEDQDPIKFWNEISKITKIPPLHIDSIIWPVLGRTFNFESSYNFV